MFPYDRVTGRKIGPVLRVSFFGAIDHSSEYGTIKMFYFINIIH